MKGSIRLLGVVACAWVTAVSGTAHGSQARNLISGAGEGGRILGSSGLFGSFYVDDAYNLFWNPAFIAGSKDWAVLEFDDASPDALRPRLDTSAGVVTSVGRHQLGVFLNRPTFTTHGSSQPIDLVFGGESGFRWGVALTRTMSTGPAVFSRLKAGVIAGQWEPFVHLTLDDTNGAAAETKTANTTFGTRYHFKDWTPYAAYRTTRETVAGVQAANGTNTYGLGVGRTDRMGDLRMDWAASYWRSVSGAAKTSVLPLNAQFSTDPATWLTLRAGFSHDLIARNVAATTTSSLGTTLHLGRAEVDSVIGETNDGVGFAENAFVNLSVTYRL